MNVDGVNASNGNAYGQQKPHPKDEGAEQTTALDPVVEDAHSDDESSRGVIRLLQEGHFKGVADVRLRINFFDELAAIEAGQLKAATEGKIDGVIEALGTPDELLQAFGEPAGDEGEALLGLQDAFVEAVNIAEEGFMGAEVPSKDVLIEALNSAFGAFIEGLWEIYGPEPEAMEEEAPASEGENEEPAAEGTVGGIDGGEWKSDTEGVGEESGVLSEPAPSMEEALESYISGLKAAFEAAMGELEDALVGVAVLPELSEASGKGVAYEKFLVIYNEMRGSEEGSEWPDGAEAVNATA
ncbi:MAG: hypothetical protein JSW23_03685 [Planctomycetota bacterium]|nr:MAG: hypothetical protein JSW23_03685 [Planctomycetota bacterium]